MSAAPPSPSPSDREAFLRDHYELIAGHATQQSNSRWNYVQLSLFGVAVFYAHLFGREARFGDSLALDVLVWLPVLLALFGGLQAKTIRKRIEERNNVLIRIERHYKFEGWAHHVDERWVRASSPFDRLVSVYWIFLFIFTTFSALAINIDIICLRSEGCS